MNAGLSASVYLHSEVDNLTFYYYTSEIFFGLFFVTSIMLSTLMHDFT